MFWSKRAFVIFLLFAQLPLTAQESFIALPILHNYTRQQYGGGTQTWDIAEGPDGRMYFANNDGLLEFDGQWWRRWPVPNGTVARSVHIDAHTHIWVGAQGMVGWFEPDERGTLRWHDLTIRIPAAHRSFEDVWTIFSGPDSTTWLRTNWRVMRYDGHRDSMAVYTFGAPLQYLGLWQGRPLVQTADGRLLHFEKESWQPLAFRQMPGSAISALFELPSGKTLVATVEDGLWWLDAQGLRPVITPLNEQLKEWAIYSATRLPDGRLALGTSRAGLVVLDSFRIVQQIDRKRGLQKSSVLSVAATRAGHVWLGLDNGISFVALNDPFTWLIPDPEEATGYAATVHEGDLYLGTASGLYRSGGGMQALAGSIALEMVRGSRGQVWHLSNHGGRLLMGHHQGAFLVEGSRATPLFRGSGTWNFLSLPDGLISGTYSGLEWYEQKGDSFGWKGHVEGLNESSRYLVQENDTTLWMAHPYRGIFRIWLSPRRDLVRWQLYGKGAGLPSDLHNTVFRIGDGVVFGTSKGVYRYVPARDTFVCDSAFSALTGWGRVQYLRESAWGDIWFVTDNEPGVIEVFDEGVRKRVAARRIPELAGQLVAGFEFIFPWDRHHILFGAERGFLHFDPARYDTAAGTLRVILHEVHLTSSPDSILFGGFGQERLPAPVLPAHAQGLRFSFAATQYVRPELVQYRTRMDGLEETWTPWSTRPEREFAHLPAGSFTFRVQARAGHVLSPETTFSFEIEGPWYAHPWAMALWLTLVFGAIGGVLWSQRRRFESERAELHSAIEQEQQRQKELKATTERIRQEKLQAEIEHKNRQLASLTMHLVQKGEMLSRIQTTLGKLSQYNETLPDEVRQEIRRLLQLVRTDNSLDEDWEQFARYFDEVHQDFLSRLREKYPQLTPNDLKLCAFLRMNLTSKEIAALLNITVRGVEASRYRLRKKLQLPSDVNLVEFMWKV